METTVKELLVPIGDDLKDIHSNISLIKEDLINKGHEIQQLNTQLTQLKEALFSKKCGRSTKSPLTANL